jgi:hypothetical protein
MAAVTLAAGCATDDAAEPAPAPSASASSSGVADPAAAQALADATAKLGTTSFKVTLTAGPGLKLVGLMDAPNSTGTADLTASGTNTEITAKSLMVGQDLYVQVTGVTKPGTWTHVDVSKLPEGANLGLRPGQIDPANTSQLLTSTTDVHTTTPGKYEGTLDLTKAAGVAGFDETAIKALGDKAKNVPFTAGVDDQGRLSALTIAIPSIDGKQAAPVEVLYTDYGTKVDAEKPEASKIIEAPASFYDSLSTAASAAPSAAPSGN